jgi:serine/threonine protein kinase
MWQVGVLMIYMVVSHYHQGYLAQLGPAAMAENLKALHDACKDSKLRELQYNYPVAVTLPGESQPSIVNATFPLFSFLNESEPALEFLEALLKYDPAERLTAKQALAHPWLSDVAD